MENEMDDLHQKVQRQMSRERLRFIRDYEFGLYYDSESTWRLAFERFKVALVAFDGSR
jgi:hypothetical protein